jgi:NADH:ubiquinone oxidoreductase subunit F (NADH-binding)
MGNSLKELVVTIAGATDVKMMQVGGASGRVIPASALDTPLSFETVLGAGAVIVYNNTRSALDMTIKTMEFFKEESCGKCVPCREGTSVMSEILQNIKNNKQGQYDLQDLQDISEAMTSCSLCGLGQAAANCFVDTLKYFSQEYKT